jgi:hypothetical protein
MPVNRVLPIVTMLSIFMGCGSTQPLTCASGEQAVITETLYFGTAKPNGTVSAEDWEVFTSDIVLAALPNGLTSWTASGRWRRASGIVEHETSHVLQLTHEESDEQNRAIQDIMRRYKMDFHQEAVMRVRSQACRSF